MKHVQMKHFSIDVYMTHVQMNTQNFVASIWTASIWYSTVKYNQACRDGGANYIITKRTSDLKTRRDGRRKFWQFKVQYNRACREGGANYIITTGTSDWNKRKDGEIISLSRLEPNLKGRKCWILSMSLWFSWCNSSVSKHRAWLHCVMK